MWYKENQILPVVKSLIQNIDEITLNQLSQSLGIKDKSHEFYLEQNYEFLNGITMQKKIILLI